MAEGPPSPWGRWRGNRRTAGKKGKALTFFIDFDPIFLSSLTIVYPCLIEAFL
jgi:hypothetical protein